MVLEYVLESKEQKGEDRLSSEGGGGVKLFKLGWRLALPLFGIPPLR